MSSIVLPIISLRVHPNTPSAEALYSIILLKLSAITIASNEPATVAANCLEEAESAAARRIADSSIRSVKSNKLTNIIKKPIAKPPVHISCLANFVLRFVDCAAANSTPRSEILRTTGRAFRSISRKSNRSDGVI